MSTGVRPGAGRNAEAPFVHVLSVFSWSRLRCSRVLRIQGAVMELHQNATRIELRAMAPMWSAFRGHVDTTWRAFLTLEKIPRERAAYARRRVEAGEPEAFDYYSRAMRPGLSEDQPRSTQRSSAVPGYDVRTADLVSNRHCHNQPDERNSIMASPTVCSRSSRLRRRVSWRSLPTARR